MIYIFILTIILFYDILKFTLTIFAELTNNLWNILFSILKILKIIFNINCTTCVMHWIILSRWFQIKLTFWRNNVLKCNCNVLLLLILLIFNVNKRVHKPYLFKTLITTLIISQFGWFVINNLKFNNIFLNFHNSLM